MFNIANGKRVLAGVITECKISVYGRKPTAKIEIRTKEIDFVRKIFCHANKCINIE